MPSAGFTIKLGEGAKRVSMDALTEILKNALEMLRSVGKEFISAGTELRWEVVDASSQSPLTLTFAPHSQGNGGLPPGLGMRVAATCVRGMKQLERKAVLPPRFNEDALHAADKLICVAQKDGAKLTVASSPLREVTLTAQAIEHIRQVVEKARIYLDYGTLEGRLEEISIHGATRITIWEVLTNHKIECTIAPDQLEQAKAMLGYRVAVSGRVRYRNHKPTTIQVENIRCLRDASELPQLEDMPPIDITNGLSSEEHVRRMRDAQ